MSRTLVWTAIRGGVALALAALGCGLTMTPAVAASSALDPDAQVRVIAAAPAWDETSVQLGAAAAATATVPYGAASGWLRVPAGPIPITISGASGTIELPAELDPGLAYDLLVDQPAGVTGAPAAQLLPVPLGRVPDGQAGARVVCATADLGAVSMTNPATTEVVVAQPFAASPRLDVSPGAGGFDLARDPSGEPVAHVDAVVAPDTLLTIVWMGAGEHPLHAIVLVDAVQPPQPPSPSTPIETGDGSGGSASARWPAWPVVAVSALIGLALLVGIAADGRSHGRRSGALMVVVALMTACASSASRGTPAAPGGTTGAATAGFQPAPAPSTPPPLAAAMPPTFSELTIPRLGITRAAFHDVASSDLPVLPRAMDKSVVGWVVGTTPLGQPGVSLVVGHNTTRGDRVAVFEYLDQLQVGDEVTLSGSDGRELRLVVRANAVFPIGALPADLYDAATGPEVLLVTCSGGWVTNPTAHGRSRTQSRVVLATPV